MTNIKEKINFVVLPGEIIGCVDAIGIKLGIGLIQDKGDIVATKAGILRFKHPDTYFIENSQKRVCSSIPYDPNS
jgi:hypothetical protein